MSREARYILKSKEGKTFDHDPNLPPLPVPNLNDTLESYFESLKPFGTPAELEISRRLIDEFRNGVGPTLQAIVERKSWSQKNWINEWWERHRFHSLRYSLYPYVAMALPLPLESVGVMENEEYSLKAAARCLYHKIEFWDLLHREKIRPVTPPDGMKYFSMEIFKRLFCTSRIPDDPYDTLKVCFKTAAEGNCPSHGILIARGRIFQFQCVKPNGELVSPEEILQLLQCVRGTVNVSKSSDYLPILTCDDRSSWAKNRKQLQELSSHNRQLLELIESSIVTVCFDENSPKTYSESSQLALSGDFHSKWADRSNIMVVYRNGKISFIGEPSAYDARCSVSLAFFILLSLLETREPNWNQVPTLIAPPLNELVFDLNEQLRTEIGRVVNDCEARRDELSVSYEYFSEYGRELISECNVHWDSFIQMALQLTYIKMHRNYPSVNESILLRNYYQGRTENLRCTSVSIKSFLEIATKSSSTKKDILQAFKEAIRIHSNARAKIKCGNGFDRHLFALYCASTEVKYNTPELFLDPLYTKSGGNTKCSLFTSTSGFTAINVFRAPMVKDGYGFFYCITATGIQFITTAWKSSSETSAHKFATAFRETLLTVKTLLLDLKTAKL